MIPQNKKVRLLIGFVVFVLFVFVVFIGSQIIPLLPFVSNLLSSARNITAALLLVSMALASIFYIHIKLDGAITIPPTKLSIKLNPEIISCFFSLPYEILGVLFVVGVLGIFFIIPICRSPLIMIDAEYNGNKTSIPPNSMFPVSASSSVILKASTTGDIPITCHWYYAGGNVQSVYPDTQCNTRLMLSQKPGNAMVTLVAVEASYCDSQTYPFIVTILNPTP
jgi:hypothetical protein